MAVYKSSKPTKDGRSFFFRIKYKDIFGVIHDYSSQKYLHRREAIVAEAEFRSSKEYNSFELSDPTIQFIFNEYISMKKKINKKQSIGKEINLFRYLAPIQNIRISELSVPRYKKFYEYIYNLPYSADHRTSMLQLLRRLINYSSKYYNTSDLIVKFIEPIREPNAFKREMDFFTYDEFKRFIAVVDDYNYHTLFDLLYFTGIRIGEALGLQWKDIDFLKSTISINKTASTKLGEFYTLSTPKTKNSIRVLPISKKLLYELKSVQKTHTSDVDYSDEYFVFGAVRPFPDTTIQKKKNHYCDLANLRHIRIHDFRHSFASFMLNNGASIMLVSKYLGHSNISITLNTYTHLYNSEMVQVADFVDKLM